MFQLGESVREMVEVHRIVLYSALFFSLLAMAGGEEKAPLIFYWDQVAKTDWEEQWGELVNEGVLYENLVAPPHNAMKKTALATGKHAFFSGVYGDYPAHNRFVPENKEAVLPIPEGEELLNQIQVLTKSREGLLLIVGKDFAWLKGKDTVPRVESRPITPEDLGASALLAGKYIDKQPINSGRDIRESGDWPDLATHVGTWTREGIYQPERMRYKGGRVLSGNDVWEDGMFWKGKPVDKVNESEWEKFAEAGLVFRSWWADASKKLLNPPPIKVSADKDAVTQLGPDEWLSSVVEIGIPYLPEDGLFWTRSKLNKKMEALSPPGFGGRWKLDIIQEGNYEVTFSLNLPGTQESDCLLFKKGSGLIRIGKSIVKMDILDKAEEISVRVDFSEGEQDLEINVTGQGAEEAGLSVPYARLKYLGPRVAPVISFPGQR